MLICLVMSTFLATPSPSAQLGILAPPTAEGRLRDQVWPAFDDGPVGRWVLVRRTETVAELARKRPPTVGAIWASETDAGIIIHRVLFAEGTHLQDRVDLPADAPPQAVTEAVRLRLRFILEAPVDAGERWQIAAAPPPLPDPPAPVPSARRDDLITQRAPPVPRRAARVPDPPPPLPEAVILPDEVVGSHVEPTVAVRMGLGADGLWSTGGWDAGLQGFFALALGHDWTVGLDGAFHPFHDLQRDGRPLGVTGYRATVFGQRKLVQRPGWRWDVRAGLGISGLSAVGAETQGSELQPTLTAAAPLRMALTGPLALEVDLGFVVTPGATRALHQNATLVERGAVQVRSGVLLTWTIR